MAYPQMSVQPTGQETCAGPASFQQHMETQSPTQCAADPGVAAANAANQAQAAQSFNPTAAAERVQPTGHMEALREALGTNDPYKQMDQIKHRMMEMLESGKEYSPTELFALQGVMQNATHRVELMAKIVEHGTSGTKTVLQTQA